MLFNLVLTKLSNVSLGSGLRISTTFSEWINLIVIIVLSVLTFVPWKFVHPLRVKSFRNLTIFFTVVWAATTLRLVTKSEINLIVNDTIVLLIWLICTGYFIYICFLRSIKDY